jgi:hypothetical protein
MVTSILALPEARYFTIPNPRLATEDLDHYGFSLSADTSFLAVGSPRAQAKGSPSEGGTVHIKALNTTSYDYEEFIHNPNLSGGGRFGHSLAVTTPHVLIGAPDSAVNGTSLAGAAYLFLFSVQGQAPISLTNPNPEGFENFGTAVALNASYSIVSGRGINTAAAGAGIVHIYNRSGSGNTPYQVAFSIPNPSPGSGEFFGESLSLVGTRLIIGNPGDEGGRGSVYVYELSGGPPTAPVLVITNPMGTAENERFGQCLALDCDKLAVGAPSGLALNGRAYVFDLAGVTPETPAVSLVNPDPFIWEAYGSSIALRGDKLLVGCPADIPFGNFIGSVYEYDLASATPSAVAYHLQSPDPNISGGESFGSAVAFAGTSYKYRVVGAPGNDRLMPDAGDVHTFEYVQPAGVVSRSSASHRRLPPDHRYGDAVALHGDKLFVGAHTADSPGFPNSGVVYLYDLLSTTPTEPALTLSNPEPDSEDWFGHQIVVSGSRLVISAPYDRVATSRRAGTVYVYDLNSADPYTPQFEIPSPNIAYQALFGATLALDGDILVSGGNFGIYAFDLSSSTPAEPVVTLSGSGQSSRPVAVSGRRIAIGTFNGDVSDIDSAGWVSLYDLDSPTPNVRTHLFEPPSPVQNGFFGRSLSMEGDFLVIGATSVPGRALEAGAIYVYDLASTTPTVPVYELNDSAPQQSGKLGYDLVMDGSKVLSSKARHLDNGMVTAGAGLLYGLQRTSPEQVAATLPSQFSLSSTHTSLQVALSQNWAAISNETQNSTSPRGGFVNVYGTPIPEIIVEQVPGVSLTDGNSTVDFGYGVQSIPKTLPFTVRNVGIHTLEVSGVNFATGNTADFSHAIPGFPLSIPAGGSLVIPVSFTGDILGARATELRIMNTDEDEGPFNINLIAYSITERQGWRFQHFQTIENTGNAANGADPDGDGFDNADEFLTGTIPVDAASRLRLEIQPHPSLPGQMNLIISPTRTMVNYRIEVNQGLSGTGWQTLWEGSGSGAGQMPLLDPSSFGQNTRFYRLIAN